MIGKGVVFTLLNMLYSILLELLETKNMTCNVG